MSYNPRVLELYAPEQLRAELEKVGAESSGLGERIARATFRVLKLERAPLALARFLYQELTMEGGQVVTAARLDHSGPGDTDVLLCATRYQCQHLIIRLRWQADEELQLLADELERALDNFARSNLGALTLGAMRFEWGARTFLMGILNLTPDSFSRDGLIHAGDTVAAYTARAVARAHTLLADGADILDIGGESTHPAAPPLDAATEIQRVLPVIQALARASAAPLSIDTYKAETARAALDAGAQIVNDVWGLRRDPAIKRVVAARGALVVITHNWLDRQAPTNANDAIGVIIAELRAQVQAAQEAGVRAEQIIVDPGLGFGKTVAQNLEILNRLGEFKALGFPILIGPSRKGFISRVLDVPPDERAEGTAAALALALARGADLVRVHDVKAMARVAKMADAIVRGKPQVTGHSSRAPNL